MYHVAMEVQVILWDIITQSLKKREKDSRANFFILNNKNNNKNAKIHNKNAAIGVLEDLEITISGTSRRFPKVKKFPLKSVCSLTGLHICDFYKNWPQDSKRYDI